MSSITVQEKAPGASPRRDGEVHVESPSETSIEKAELELRNISGEDMVTLSDTELGAAGLGQGGWGAAATRKLRLKMDTRLLPFLSLLYLLSFLDRTNIGNGKLADLEKDLHIDPTSIKFNIAVAIFFPFYVAAEIPSNLAMKRFRPSIWIPSIMVAWGVCCLGMGFVKNYEGLLIARSAMGFAEGGLFPGVTYYITLWYKRAECGLRMAIFFSAATAAGAFGGLLARGIIEMDGLGGLGGWSWILSSKAPPLS
jgi:MFS family permease